MVIGNKKGISQTKRKYLKQTANRLRNNATTVAEEIQITATIDLNQDHNGL
jgi:hypothetical protein